MMQALDAAWKKPRGQYDAWETNLRLLLGSEPVLTFVRGRNPPKEKIIRDSRAEPVLSLARSIHARSPTTFAQATWQLNAFGTMLVESPPDRRCVAISSTFPISHMKRSFCDEAHFLRYRSTHCTGGICEVKKFSLAFVTLLTGCLTATAHAATAVRDPRQQVVSYADLNLQSEADAATLSRRIKSAARSVCGVRSAGRMALAMLRLVERCADQATARAVADVNAPLLTRQAMHLDTTARPDSRPPVLARSEIEIRNAVE